MACRYIKRAQYRPRGRRGEGKKLIKELNGSFPLMGEGEDEGEYLRFNIPWHIATLIKEWAQYIVPLQFLYSFVGA